MTGQEIFLTSLIISATGFLVDVLSERLDDLFVRRVSVLLWLGIGLLVTITCQFVYSQTASVSAVVCAASTLTIIGEGVGVKLVNHLSIKKTRRVQERAKKWVNRSS